MNLASQKKSEIATKLSHCLLMDVLFQKVFLKIQKITGVLLSSLLLISSYKSFDATNSISL